jgi:hypothetical protein
MATNVSVMPRGNVWHRRFGPAMALAIIAVPLAVVLLWLAMQPRVDPASMGIEVRQTAALVDEHASAMVRIGERIVASATGSTAPSRLVWIAYGQHMISDGKVLTDLAARISSTATVAETDPLHGSNAGLSAAVLQSRWEQLRADGRATATHGRVMIQMADQLGGAVRDGILTDADVQQIRAASAGMVDAGDRCAGAAGMLLASADQMQRWMGSNR